MRIESGKQDSAASVVSAIIRVLHGDMRHVETLLLDCQDDDPGIGAAMARCQLQTITHHHNDDA